MILLLCILCMTDRADTCYVPFIYLPCSFISEIHKIYATKISVLERNLRALRREKIKRPSDGNSAKKVGTKPAFNGLCLKSVQRYFQDPKPDPRKFWKESWY